MFLNCNVRFKDSYKNNPRAKIQNEVESLNKRVDTSYLRVLLHLFWFAANSVSVLYAFFRNVRGFPGGAVGFPGGAVVENLPANAGDTGSSPGLGRSHMPWSNWAREP